MRPKRTTIVVDEGFKAIIKAEAALNGKSVFQFTRDVAKDEKLFSEYLCDDKQKGLRRKNGFGFRF